MSYTIWERREPIEKRTAIASREEAQRIIAELEAFAAESFRDRSPADALTALWRSQPGAAVIYRHAQNYLLSHAPAAESDRSEGTKSMSKSMPTSVEVSKRLKSTNTEIGARDVVADLMREALDPVVKAIQAADGLDEAKATNAAYRVTPGAYRELRRAQDALGRVDAAWLAKMAEKVRATAVTLAATVSKSGAGSLEDRMLATASRLEWED